MRALGRLLAAAALTAGLALAPVSALAAGPGGAFEGRAAAAASTSSSTAGAPATQLTAKAAASSASGASGQLRPTAVSLSETGQLAVDDLRTCLASDDTLNVYYLIDNSLSLAYEDDGVTPGTDPEALRADILGSSLRQLGTLRDDLAVNWAAGFFSTDFTPALGWQPWTPQSDAQLADTIRAKKPGGYTNWLAGLRGAQSALAAQQREAPGCQVVVWLTDGMMDLANNAEEQPALDALCGTGPSDWGVLNAMRQSGTVVFGVLLADQAVSADAAILRPLVEGQGSIDGVQRSCGQQPIPSTHANGAVIEAADPAALALVFLELATRISGGYPAPLAADGSFFIDPGVARFQFVIGGGDWSLDAPAEAGRAPMTAAAPWPDATITRSGSATVVDVPIREPEQLGQWRLDAADVRDVFLFSDLRIVFDAQNKVELGADGTASSTIGATVQRADGAPADLGVYGTAQFRAAMIPADGSAPIPLPGADVDPASGTIGIPLPADIDAAELVLSASIDPLVTAPHGLVLAPVTTQQRIPTVLPASFPRIESVPVRLGELTGREGLAQGVIRVQPAPDGTATQVCVSADVTVASDAAERAETWAWTVGDSASDGSSSGGSGGGSGAGREASCIDVPAGEGVVEIPVTAANAIPADSEVRASTAVTFVSAAGDEIVQQVPIAFSSTRPLNPAATGLLALGLLALGILAPLVILWFVNWFATTLSIARNTQRGVLPVTIDGVGVHPSVAVDERSLGASVFQNRPPIERERAIHDPDLGVLRARVPWWPVGDTWFEAVPPAGSAIVLARTGTRAGSLGTRAKAGDRAVRFSNLPLDAFTAIVVGEEELRRTRAGDAVAARVIMYHRPELGDAGQYTRRIGELQAESDLLKRVDRLREALAAGDASAHRGASGASAARGAGGRGTAGSAGLGAGDAPGAGAGGGNGAAPPPPPRRAGASTPPPGTRGGSPPSVPGRGGPPLPPSTGAGPGAPPPPPPRGR